MKTFFCRLLGHHWRAVDYDQYGWARVYRCSCGAEKDPEA